MSPLALCPKPPPATTAARATAPANYFARVAELLTPLDSDSARIDAIAANSALQTELMLMAEDSLTWGSHAARTALNFYAGTRYTIWLADAAAAELDSTATAGNRAQVTTNLWLAPNPSDGHVTVTCTLPATTQAALLVIYDAWGTEVARHMVGREKASTDLHLNLPQGLYHATLVAQGAIVARERLLIESR